MNIYIGAENIITPLGTTAEENFAALNGNISGIKKFEKVGFDGKDIYLSKFSNIDGNYTFDSLLSNCLNAIKDRIAIDVFSSDKTLVILSTTKGDIKNEIVDAIGKPVAK